MAGSPRVGLRPKNKGMAYAQIRVRSISSGSISSTEVHNKRLFSSEDCPDNIDISRTAENHIIYARDEWADENKSLADMIYSREKELGVKGIRQNSIHAIEVVVSVSDINFFQSPQGGYSTYGYGLNEMKWLEDNYFGRGNVLCGYLHSDESKPHWHFICLPVKEKEISFKNRYGSGTKKEMRLAAQDFIGGANKLHYLQEAYYKHCKARYGHIVPFWRGLLAEEQKRQYTQKTDHQLNKYREAEQYAEMKLLAKEAQEKVQQYDQTIEKKNQSRQRPSYQWDKNSEVPEWKWGKRGR